MNGDDSSVAGGGRAEVERLRLIWRTVRGCACQGGGTCESCWWFEKIRRKGGVRALALFLDEREPDGPIYKAPG